MANLSFPDEASESEAACFERKSNPNAGLRDAGLLTSDIDVNWVRPIQMSNQRSREQATDTDRARAMRCSYRRKRTIRIRRPSDFNRGAWVLQLTIRIHLFNRSE